MDNNIVAQYEVLFKNDASLQFNKSLSTNSKYLTRFLFTWIDPDEIEDTMIPGLLEGQTDSETVGVFVRNGIAKFYDLLNDGELLNTTPDFSMPLVDLIDIANGWKDFLRTPFKEATI